MNQKEAVKELHDRVRQCLTRHKFKTFGDIMTWWHNEEFEICEMEAGEQGMSKFSTDLMWLIGLFGPNAQIDHKIMGAKKVPALKKVKILMEAEEEEDSASKTTRLTKKSVKKTTRRKKRRRF